MAASPTLSPSPETWTALFDELTGAFAGCFAGCFARREPRLHAFALTRGLMADLPRKNCWTIAEHLGHASPDPLLTSAPRPMRGRAHRRWPPWPQQADKPLWRLHHPE